MMYPIRYIIAYLLLVGIAACAVTSFGVDGRYAVIRYVEVNGNVYRDVPDVYLSLTDCIDALSSHITDDTIALDCVIQQ